MKKKILNKIENILKKYGNYDDIKLEEIMYGIEGIYLTITKLVILFILAFLLNIVKEFLILLLFYNLLRKNCFGLHAKKSSHCLIASILMFILVPILCKHIEINYYYKVFISIIMCILIYKYAPADTYKRPIINLNKRRRFKLLSTITALIYLILIILDIKEISNYLVSSLVLITILIHPFTYKIFKLPYNNYKIYLDNLNRGLN